MEDISNMHLLNNIRVRFVGKSGVPVVLELCRAKTERVQSAPSTWTFAGQGLGNNSCAENTTISVENAPSLVQIYEVDLTQGDSDVVGTDGFSSFSADEDNFYFCTYNKYLASGVMIPNDGSLWSVSRSDGYVNFVRSIASYSGAAGDLSRAAPMVFEGHLYLATNLSVPQYLSPTTMANYALFGVVDMPVRGAPPKLLKIDKITGNLVSSVPIGAVASSDNDPDNWITVSSSPTIAKVQHQGVVKNVVALGTSSGQSVVPWLISLRSFVPGPDYYFGDSIDFQMTDVGKIVLVDADSMTVISSTEVTPRKPAVGTVVSSTSFDPTLSDFYAPDQQQIAIRVTVDSSVRASEFGSSSGIKKNYKSFAPEVNNFVRYLFYAGRPVPPPAIGYKVWCQDGVRRVLPPTSSLPAEFDRTSVTVPVAFRPGTTKFWTLEAPTVLYEATNPANIPDYSVVLKFYRRRARPGDDVTINTDREAYQFGYYGASTWGNSPAWRIDPDSGLAVGLYVGSGQNHQIPYFEPAWIYTDGEFATKTFFERENYVAAVMRLDPNDRPAIVDAYARKLRWLQNELAVELSGRGAKNYHSSVISVSLADDSTFGSTRWFFRTVANDYWHAGFTNNALRNHLSQNATPPILPPNATQTAGFPDIQEFYVAVRGADGDFGAGPMVISGDRVVAVDKAGDAVILQDAGSDSVLLHWTFVGNPGTLGGSNYGNATDGTRMYSLQVNSTSQSDVNAHEALIDLIHPNRGYPQNFQVQKPWYAFKSDSVGRFEVNQSYLTAVDLTTGKISWEARILPTSWQTSFPGQPLTSAGAVSCTDTGLVAVPSGAGTIELLNSSTGQVVSSLEIGSAGNCRPVIVGNQVAVYEGRGTLLDSLPYSSFSPANRFRVFAV
jgi:hypothetical protein